MDNNQVGSINFDANALYLEEDSEHEDDKQQDNEVNTILFRSSIKQTRTKILFDNK